MWKGQGPRTARWSQRPCSWTSSITHLQDYPGTDHSGNYVTGVWTDLDSDGDIDLFIAKCRQEFVNDPNDPRFASTSCG